VFNNHCREPALARRCAIFSRRANPATPFRQLAASGIVGFIATLASGWVLLAEILR